MFPTFSLKPLHKDAVDSALAKAERYRLLNEPAEAESICHDILATDAENQHARITLLLALTDLFREDPTAYHRAQEALTHITGEYERAYYAGMIAERRGKAQVHLHSATTIGIYDWIRDAMEHYERAEALRPAGNDDATLRWNACVRFLEQHRNLRPGWEERGEFEMLE